MITRPHRLFIPLLGLAFLTAAAPPPKKNIEITAGYFEMDLDSRTSYFKTNVQIRFDKYQGTCQQATVYMDEQNRLQKVVMTGQVQIRKEGSLFKGRKITLDVKKNRLQVEGQVYTRIPSDELKTDLR